jgi:hypothetical protein
MNYKKPEIHELPNAVCAVQAGESLTLAKQSGDTDAIVPDKMTPSAYSADE